MTDYFFNLPPETPEKFGEALERLCLTNMPDKYSRPVYFLENETGIDPSLIYAHLNGSYQSNKKKTLTEEHIRKYVELFWQKENGLKTPAEVVAWVRSAGNKYLVHLMSDWFGLLVGIDVMDVIMSLSPDLRHPAIPSGQQVQRTKILGQIQNCLQDCITQRRKIFLLGPVGVGKTTIMEQLRSSAGGSTEYLFDDILLADLRRDSAKNNLRRWHQRYFGVVPLILESDIEVRKTRDRIYREIKDRRCLILISNVVDPLDIRMLPISQLNRSLVIISTSSDQVVKQLAGKSDVIIEVPGFTNKQAAEYFANLFGPPVMEETEKINELNHLLEGKPYSLYNAFHLADKIGFESCINLIKNPTHNNLADPLIRDIFFPIQTFLEDMLPHQRQLTLDLGWLPPLRSMDLNLFRAFWDDEEPSPLINRLMEQGLLQPAGKNSWRINQHTQKYLALQAADRRSGGHPCWEIRAMKAKANRSYCRKRKEEFGRFVRSAIKRHLIRNRLRFMSQFFKPLYSIRSLPGVLAVWDLYLPSSATLDSRDYVWGFTILHDFWDRYMFTARLEKWLALILLVTVCGTCIGLGFSDSLAEVSLILLLLIIVVVAGVGLLVNDIYMLADLLLRLEHFWHATTE